MNLHYPIKLRQGKFFKSGKEPLLYKRVHYIDYFLFSIWLFLNNNHTYKEILYAYKTYQKIKDLLKKLITFIHNREKTLNYKISLGLKFFIVIQSFKIIVHI